jgi:hypothetical membrane protein
MPDARRIATLCGVVAPALALLAVVVPTFLTPSFSWTGTSISHMGAAGMPAAVVLNGGLILAGLVGLPFVWRLWVGADHPLENAGTLLFAVSVLGLIGVGVFPLPHPNHGPVAITHFVAYTVGLWVYGTGTALAGRVRWGLATVWLGIGHVLAWVLWAVAGLEGIALPEAAGSVVFAGWLFVTARRFLAGEAATAGATAGTAG